jgi:hypothetical protein
MIFEYNTRLCLLLHGHAMSYETRFIFMHIIGYY